MIPRSSTGALCILFSLLSRSASTLSSDQFGEDARHQESMSMLQSRADVYPLDCLGVDCDIDQKLIFKEDSIDKLAEQAQIYSNETVDALTAEVMQLRKQLEAYQRHSYPEDLEIAIAAEQQENICFDGKLVPELYLFGSLKTSSTLLADNFNLSEGVVESRCMPWDLDNGAGDCPSGGTYWKAPQFFNNRDVVAQGYSAWLDHWPSCRQDTRMVAADMSVGYLHAHDDVLPVLKDWYGINLRRVTFVVTVREPMATMQSYFYYIPNLMGITIFKDWVQGMIDDPSKRLHPSWRNSMYAENLAACFDAVDRSQFMIVPMKYNTQYNKGTAPFHEYLWRHFGLPHAPTRDYVVEVSNVNPHPSLEDDLGTDLYNHLQGIMYNVTGPARLADILRVKTDLDEAPYLHGFQGLKHNETAIAEWITDGW